MLESSIKELTGYIETINKEPDFVPRLFYDSLKIYNGYLYIYDFLNEAWIKSSIANMEQSQGTSLPTASSNSGKYYYLTTTDTLYRSNGTAWIALN